MRSRKVICFLLVLVLACPFFASANAEAKNASWTILIYLDGTNLESDRGYASRNIQDMLAAPDSAEINLVLETGGATEWQNGIDATAICRYVRSGDEFQLAEKLPGANMGEADTLQDFITWGVENYPADRIGLILWDHGSTSINGVCADYIYDRDSLSLTEIDSVMKNVTEQSLPGGFEFIGFDACVMASLEAACTVAPYGKYMYASEESEPGTGWDYKSILTWLAENPQADGLEFGNEQCVTYQEWQSASPSETFSIIDLSKVGAVADAFEAAIKETMEAGGTADLVRAILKTDSFGPNNRLVGYINMVDIKGMIEKVAAYAPSAQKVLDAIEDAVVYRINGPSHYGAGGLSIYYPVCYEGGAALDIFKEICPSASYYDLVSLVASDSISSGSSGSVFGNWDSVGLTGVFNVVKSYINENGTYTAVLDSSSMNKLSRATCIVAYIPDDIDDNTQFIGETTAVNVDMDTCRVSDRFNGKCLKINGSVVPTCLISRNENIEEYTAPILLKGKEMNLRILHDVTTDVYSLDGISNNVDPVSGMADRTLSLESGDVITFCYYDLTDREKVSYSDPVTIDEDLTFEIGTLPEGYYYYTIILYDLSGNMYPLEGATFRIDDDGTLSVPRDLN